MVSPYPTEEVNATLLASWTYGLGKAVALTTDAGPRWAADWAAWPGYDKFISQMVRWSMRPVGESGTSPSPPTCRTERSKWLSPRGSCVEIRAGNSVDVIEIDAATNRGIDDICELREAARYRPARDRFKIYILDELTKLLMLHSTLF